MKKSKTIGLLTLLLGVLALAGCKQTEYVPVTHTEYVTRVQRDTLRDSIYVRDSIKVAQRGDTLTVERWHTVYKDRWRTLVKADTVEVRDTTRVPVLFERKLTKWERTKMQTGGVTLVVLAIGACVVLVYVWRKLRKWARNGI